MSLRHPHPTLTYEHEMLRAGAGRVAGIDEVGRGALAGPVAAAAVVLPVNVRPWFEQVNDSKLLTPAVREELAAAILAEAAVGLAMVSAERIDAEGIVPATKRAMLQAFRALGLQVDGLLVDAVNLSEAKVQHLLPLVHGDQLSLSIASASIVAKVARDRLMQGMDRSYPGYHLGRNKGYGTPLHREAIMQLGPSAIHRLTFLSKIVRGTAP